MNFIKRVFIVGVDYDMQQLFNGMGCAVVEDPKEAELAVFTGGEDISPSIYDQPKHPKSYHNESRDDFELQMYQYFLERNIPMVGICRGGQLLNVLNGGSMYQHVNKHTSSHCITDARTGEVMFVTSLHHQMMKPAEKAELIAFSQNKGFREEWDGQVFHIRESDKDPEALFYEDTQCLCFQPHPEYMAKSHPRMVPYFKSILQEKFQ